MNINDFLKATEIMAKGLPTPNVADRLEVLYMSFGEHPIQLIEETAKECANTLDRFPVPAKFQEIMHKVKKRMPRELFLDYKKPCSICKGEGRISIEAHNPVLRPEEKGVVVYCYACRCENGIRFRGNHPLYPKTIPDPDNLYQELARNPQKFFKGLNYLRKFKIKIPQSAVDKIQKAVKDAEEVPF